MRLRQRPRSTCKCSYLRLFQELPGRLTGTKIAAVSEEPDIEPLDWKYFLGTNFDMTSRYILALSLIALSALVFLGGMALHFSASPAAADSDWDRGMESAERSQVPAPSLIYPPEGFAQPAAGVSDFEPRRSVAADTLRRLLTRVHVLFDAGSSQINDGMIPYLAQIITLVNQQDDVVYLFDIFEPDAELARHRAQVLNEVLRLNVLNPAGLRISGHEGSHGVRVNVSI
jgi:hypothetical protein